MTDPRGKASQGAENLHFDADLPDGWLDDSVFESTGFPSSYPGAFEGAGQWTQSFQFSPTDIEFPSQTSDALSGIDQQIRSNILEVAPTLTTEGNEVLPGPSNEPWTSARAVGAQGPYGNKRRRLDNAGLDFPRYPSGTFSESAAHSLARTTSDSGYVTWVNQETESIYSGVTATTAQGSQDLRNSFRNVQLDDTVRTTYDADGIPRVIRDSDGHLSSQVVHHCNHPGCNFSCRTPSDWKKHLDRHTKPYKCDVPGCKNTKGFANINDLERHRTAVHKLAPRKGTVKQWRCQFPDCRHPNKPWPRLDNFKSHLKRMHNVGDADIDNEVQRSETLTGAGEVEQSPTMSPVSTISEHVFHQSTPDYLLEHDRGVRTRSASDASGLIGRLPSPGFIPLSTSSNYGSQNSPVAQTPNHGLRIDPSSYLKVPQWNYALALRNSQSVRGNSPESRSPVPDIRTDSHKSESVLDRPRARFSDQVNTNTKEEFPQLTALAEGTPGLLPAQSYDEKIAILKDMGLLEQVLEAGLAAKNISGSSEMSRSASWSPGRLHSSKSNGSFQCPYQNCSKSMDRPSELRKHIKRHERRYRCTAARSCGKTFGSKADWKRHESTQHFHSRRWICQELIGVGNNRGTSFASQTIQRRCEKPFDRLDIFRTHVQSTHNVSIQEDITAKARLAQMDAEEDVEFWCGFCKEVFPLGRSANGSVDSGSFSSSRSTSRQSGSQVTDRFDHIDQHIRKGQVVTDDYWTGCPYDNTISESSDSSPTPPASDSRNNNVDLLLPFELDDQDLLENKQMRPQTAHQSQSKQQQQQQQQQRQPLTVPSSSSRKGKEKATTVFSSPAPTPFTTLKVDEEEEDSSNTPQIKPKEMTMCYCCRCQEGPFLIENNRSCVMCDHIFCYWGCGYQRVGRKQEDAIS